MASDESAWVIESVGMVGRGSAPATTYWTGENVGNFSPDSNAAIRFVRQQDADVVRCHILPSDISAHSVTRQHIWLATAPVPPEEPCITLVLNGQPISLVAEPTDRLVTLLPRAWKAAGIADCFQLDTRWHFKRRSGVEVDHEMTVGEFGDELLFVHLGVPAPVPPEEPTR